MASILILSQDSASIPLGVHLANEGHICKLYISTVSERLVGNSKNPTIVSDPMSFLDQYDIIICLDPGFADECETLRERGKIVFGSTFHDKLVNNEEYFKAVLNVVYKSVPFTEVELEENYEYILTTGWFNGEDFIIKYVTLPVNRMMEHNRGMIMPHPNLITFIPEGSIYDKTLTPLKDLLLKVDFIGPITVGSYVTPNEMHVASIHPWLDSTIYPFMELCKSSLWNIMWKCAQKKDGFTYNENSTAMAINVSIPPYPYPTDMIFQVEHIFSPPEPAKSHIHCSINTNGFVGYITARGENINEARRRVYRTINNSINHNASFQYRSDIGYDLEDVIKKLQLWGYLNA